MARTDDNWIQTYSGLRYHPTDPHSDDVRMVDIAHHLSNICRFTGATRKFYSVAQHCVIMSRMPMICEAGLAWLALLHDAAEAYTGDFARPVKRSCEEMQAMDTANTLAVLKHFGMDDQFPFPPEIDLADRIMLATERRDLLENSPSPWKLIDREKVQPLPDGIFPMLPEQAKEAFCNRVRELRIGR